MSVNDPIADMLTRIRNATMRNQAAVSVPHSNIKEAIAGVLKEEGYVEDYQVLPEKPQAVLRLKLKYVGGRRERHSVITNVNRVSRTGRRVYVGKQNIPWVLDGMGVAIVTTSKGVMTDQKARRLGVGGEILCQVW